MLKLWKGREEERERERDNAGRLNGHCVHLICYKLDWDPVSDIKVSF